MTDLEMVKLCAEAMGLTAKTLEETTYLFDKGAHERLRECLFYGDGEIYDPLHDDAQAMALVKRFPGCCVPAMVNHFTVHPDKRDYNRAIVETVAKMQGQVRRSDNEGG